MTHNVKLVRDLRTIVSLVPETDTYKARFAFSNVMMVITKINKHKPVTLVTKIARHAITYLLIVSHVTLHCI